jgi:antitoxin (DNA-binding transcriptional repressor) of toxin-antitoxin stability system
MTLVTVAEARKNLPDWLRRAKAGEEIGIVYGNQIFAVRPVSVTSIDRAQSDEAPAKTGILAPKRRA